MARRSGQTDLLAETLRDLAKLYEPTDRERSLLYKSEYLDISDSIFNINEFNSLKNAQFQYELNKSNRAINVLTETTEMQESQIKTQRAWILTITIGLILLATIILIVVRQKKKLRDTYNILFERNQANLNNEQYYKRRMQEIEAKYAEEKKTWNERIDKTEPLPSESQETQSTSISLTSEVKEKLIADITHIMENTTEFCDSDFSIEKLSKMVGSNSTYLSKIINDEFGKNFRTFLNEYRIREAMLRLNDTKNYGNYTIKAISESVGYKSQPNFISVFTKITGMKPSIYQKLASERK